MVPTFVLRGELTVSSAMAWKVGGRAEEVLVSWRFCHNTQQGGLAVPPPELSIPRRRAEAAEASGRAWQERGRHWGSGTCTALEGGLTWNVPDII